MANFKQAPLPFVGQKRMFLNHFKQVLNENIEGDGEGWTIVDVFGGSGLLSHTAKRTKPLANVIYNDFDGYAERLKHIPDINRLRHQIYEALIGCPRDKRLNNAKKLQIVDIIKQFNGYKDLNCLASWLLFSGNQVGSLDALFRCHFLNCVRQSDYPQADDYLNDIEVICESFHTLLPRFAGKEKVLLILDPPYLCTKQESYKKANYFDLIDFLRLIYSIKPPYIFFSSTKSEFIRFIEAMVEDKWQGWQPFEGTKRIVVNTTVSHCGQYEDNLVYKF